MSLFGDYRPMTVSLSLITSAAAIAVDGSVRLSARVAYVNETPVTSAGAIFTSDGTRIGSAATVRDGVAELIWSPERPGNATLTADMENWPSFTSGPSQSDPKRVRPPIGF